MAARMLEKFKPAAPVAAHLFLAGALWSLVGLFLLARGFGAATDLSAWTITWIGALGLILGALKGTRVLAPSARRSVRRILERGDGKCIGGFLSWKSWLVVATMMTMGRFMRGSSMPGAARFGVLTVIGTALFIGSTIYWQALWRHRSS